MAEDYGPQADLSDGDERKQRPTPAVRPSAEAIYAGRVDRRGGPRIEEAASWQRSPSRQGAAPTACTRQVTRVDSLEG